MIALTRTTGERCDLDPAQIQRVERCPETVVVLTDGALYAVRESVDEVRCRVRDYWAGVRVAAWRLVRTPGDTAGRSGAGLVPVRG